MQKLLPIISALLAFLLLGCSAPDQSISKRLAEQVESRQVEDINLQPIVPGNWDRFCAIGPYATNQLIEERIGFSWDGRSKSSIGTNDSITLLLFIKDKQVVAFTEHPRGKGDFLELSPRCLSATQATLHRKKDKSGWVQLVSKEQAPVP